jgi:hypothetical protein
VSREQLADLVPATFEPHRGTAFAVSSGDQALTEVRLDEVTAINARPGNPRKEPFSLVFSGPQPVLAQRIYRLDHPVLGSLDIFLVPIGLDGDRVRYEAVFN